MALTKVDLANTVEGILPVANGGTGTSTGVAPGGSTTQVQYNNAGAFGGDSGFVYTGGNVGIGTTAPGAKLEVNGTGELLRFDGTINQSRSIYFRNVGTGTATVVTDGTLNLETNAAYPITFDTNATERMRINTSGDLLLGQTSSAYTNAGRGLISINGSSEAFVGFNTGGTYKGYIQHDGTNFTQENQTATGYIRFNTNSTERMRITSAGGVSFGATGTAYGSSGQVLTSNGNAAPTWNTLSSYTNNLGNSSVQSWQNPSRSNGTTYTNSTGNPIMVVITQRTNGWTSGGGPFTFTITVGGVSFPGSNGVPSAAGTNVIINDIVSFIVPNGVTYSASGGTLQAWSELR